MGVRHAILGILLRRPSYPYELAISFEQLIGHAWQLNKAQVYQAVERLEEEGLIERTEKNPTARGSRWSYRVTERGGEEYERWRATRSQKIRPFRDDLLIMIALASEDDADEILETIHLRKLLLAERLREYTEVHSRLVPLDEAHRWNEAGATLGMSAALGQLNFELEWLETAKETVERLQNEQQSQPGAERAKRSQQAAS